MRVNCKFQEFDVYAGRPSKWGNPFVIGQDGSREAVIAKYEVHLDELIERGEITKEELASLYGKRIACHCRENQSCHVDVLLKRVEEAYSMLFPQEYQKSKSEEVTLL